MIGEVHHTFRNVSVLRFAADRMVRDACMLVHKGSKICQGWEILALCFQVIGQCGKLVLKWPWQPFCHTDNVPMIDL